MEESKQDEKIGDATDDDDDRVAGHISPERTVSRMQGPRGHSKRAKTISSEPRDEKEVKTGKMC